MSSVARLTTANRRSINGFVGACAYAVLFSPPLHAQESWGGSLAVTSDYRVRGLSQTHGEPAAQGGLHARLSSGWIAGIWATTIDRSGDSTAAELDAYAGFGWTIAPDWNAKVSFTHYWYPNDPGRTSYDHDEISASLAYRAQLIASVSWSPNTAYFGYHESRWQAARASSASYELTGLQPLTTSISLTAGVGYNDLSRLFDAGYWYWNAGISYAMGPVQLDLARIDSDSTARYLFGSTVTKPGWSAAISWHF